MWAGARKQTGEVSDEKAVERGHQGQRHDNIPEHQKSHYAHRREELEELGDPQGGCEREKVGYAMSVAT